MRRFQSRWPHRSVGTEEHCPLGERVSALSAYMVSLRPIEKISGPQFFHIGTSFALVPSLCLCELFMLLM